MQWRPTCLIYTAAGIVKQQNTTMSATVQLAMRLSNMLLRTMAAPKAEQAEGLAPLVVAGI